VGKTKLLLLEGWFGTVKVWTSVETCHHVLMTELYNDLLKTTTLLSRGFSGCHALMLMPDVASCRGSWHVFMEGGRKS